MVARITLQAIFLDERRDIVFVGVRESSLDCTPLDMSSPQYIKMPLSGKALEMRAMQGALAFAVLGR